MNDIIRAVITAYYAASHTADVRPVMGPAAVLEGLPVIESCRPNLLAADDLVAVLLWSDVGGLVLGPWGAVPAIPPSATDADTVDGEHAAAFADASHAHAGEHITAGTVADVRIAGTLARDSEVATAITNHAAASHAHHPEASVRVYRDVVLAIGNSSWTVVPFTHQRWDDPNDDHWVIGAPTRLTCRHAGPHIITAHASWGLSTVGQRFVGIYLNATTILAYSHLSNLSSLTLFQSVTTVYKLSITDFLEMRVLQDSGGNLNLNSAGNNSPEFAMARIP